MPCGSYFSTVDVKNKKVCKIFHNSCYLIPATFFSWPTKTKPLSGGEGRVWLIAMLQLSAGAD